MKVLHARGCERSHTGFTVFRLGTAGRANWRIIVDRGAEDQRTGEQRGCGLRVDTMSRSKAMREKAIGWFREGNHLWVGLVWMVACELLLFGGYRWVGIFFTPLIWWGYIIAVDGAVRRLRGRSLLVDSAAEFRVMAVLSVPLWLIFEYYNLFIENWHYIGLPTDPKTRLLGYATAFATILPAMVETADLVGHWLHVEGAPPPGRRRLDRRSWSLIAIGALMLVVPLLFPSPYLAALVFLGFIPLLDPVQHARGLPSLLADAEHGSWSRGLSLVLGGTLCGVLWEFWNFWALAKWKYTVPILPEMRIFEMPVLGYFGFGPFALEMYLLYLWLRGDQAHDLAAGPRKPHAKVPAA